MPHDTDTVSSHETQIQAQLFQQRCESIERELGMPVHHVKPEYELATKNALLPRNDTPATTLGKIETLQYIDPTSWQDVTDADSPQAKKYAAIIALPERQTLVRALVEKTVIKGGTVFIVDTDIFCPGQVSTPSEEATASYLPFITKNQATTQLDALSLDTTEGHHQRELGQQRNMIRSADGARELFDSIHLSK